MAWHGIEVRGVPAGMRRIWPVLVARGSLMAVFGILTLAWPALTAVVLISLFGAYAVIDGVMTIGYGIASRRAGRGGRGWLLQGGIAIVFGLIALFWPTATGSVVLMVLGFWALLIGIVVAVIGLQLRRSGPRMWLWPFLLGALGIILGLVLIIEPAEAMVGLAAVLGIFTVLGGAALIAGGLRLRRLQLT